VLISRVDSVVARPFLQASENIILGYAWLTFAASGQGESCGRPLTRSGLCNRALAEVIAAFGLLFKESFPRVWKVYFFLARCSFKGCEYVWQQRNFGKEYPLQSLPRRNTQGGGRGRRAGFAGMGRFWMFLDAMTILASAVLATLYRKHTSP